MNLNYDKFGTTIVCEDGGAVKRIAVDPENFDYATLVESGATIQPYVPVSTDVDEERDRRVDAGLIFENVMFKSDETARKRVSEFTPVATFAMQGDNPEGDLTWGGFHSEDFYWVEGDKPPVPMDACTFTRFATAMMRRTNDHTVAARKLKDTDPIPGDYADDRHWPD